MSDAIVIPYTHPSTDEPNHVFEQITSVCDYLDEISSEEEYVDVCGEDLGRALTDLDDSTSLNLGLADTASTFYRKENIGVQELYLGGEENTWGRAFIGDLTMVLTPIEELDDDTWLYAHIDGESFEGELEEFQARS